MRAIGWLLAGGWLMCSSVACGAQEESPPPRGAFNPPGGSTEMPASSPAVQEATPVAQVDKRAQKEQKEMEEQKKKLLEAEQDYKKGLERARVEADADIAACKDKFLKGRLKTHQQLVSCYNTKVSAIFLRAGYRYPDLLKTLGDKRMEVARLIDKKVLSEAKGEAELSALSERIAREEKNRDTRRLGPFADKAQ